jgi:hypothetical protein
MFRSRTSAHEARGWCSNGRVVVGGVGAGVKPFQFTSNVPSGGGTGTPTGPGPLPDVGPVDERDLRHVDDRVDPGELRQRAGRFLCALVSELVERTERLDVDVHLTRGRRPR